MREEDKKLMEKVILPAVRVAAEQRQDQKGQAQQPLIDW
jgi:hypothetical protein